MDKYDKIITGVIVFGVALLVWSFSVSSIKSSNTLEYIEKHCNVVPGAYVNIYGNLKPVYSCILNKQERNNAK